MDELLIEILCNMKKDYESAIINGGQKEVHSLIRSQNLINYIHNYIKEKLILEGVNENNIFPPLNLQKPEIKMSGFLKTKYQDITIFGSDKKEEIIENGVLRGNIDPISTHTMNHSISINIRSQLSSLAKNFDTLFERTFAEALNLHSRAPKLVMGEVYMIPIIAYDPEKIKQHKIGWKEPLPINKYIPAFKSLNNRTDITTDYYKYERVALLIIDFRDEIPKEFTSSKQLVKEGLIDDEMKEYYSLENLTTSDFVEDILKCYKNRHGSIDLLKESHFD